MLYTNRAFRNTTTYPFIYANKDIRDFIYHDYYLNGKTLYKIIGPHLDFIPTENDSIKQIITQLLESYRAINKEVCFNNKILPDSLYEYHDSFNDTLFYYNKPNLLNSDDMFPLGSQLSMNSVSGIIELQISFVMNTFNYRYQDLPRLVITIEDRLTKNIVFYDAKELKFLTHQDIKENTWIKYNTTDRLNIDEFDIGPNDIMKIYIFNSKTLQLKISDFQILIKK